MTEISPLMVKTLREKTGAGMMDCKKALSEVGGDIEAAVDWLRKKGLAAAAKKAGRVAAEGLVAVAASADGRVGAVVEVNAETDFVARNTQFQGVVLAAADTAVKGASTLEALAVAPFAGEGGSVQGAIAHLVAVIGENMNLRRVARFEVAHGVVATYMHSAVAPGLGRIGVLVALESTAPADKLQELGKKIAMHVAAAAPTALNRDGVNAADLEREKAILVDQARGSGRPEDVIQKMVEGRLRKFYEEVVLLEQAFVMDGKTPVKDIVEQTAKELGAPITLKAFARYALGEGIEKEEVDFAAEVAAQAKIAG
jgi:elongation factor Ts